MLAGLYERLNDSSEGAMRVVFLAAAGVGAGVLVVCLSGFFAARGAVNAMPVDILRGAAT